MPELSFKGKEYVRNHHLSVPHRPLELDAARSVGAPRLDGNLIIHGDNLHALKSLVPIYAGKVNCIYIDPPYNTGNEGWCYNDNVNSPQMQAWLSQNPVGIEDGLRHDKWCTMMWPRLVLLRELLAEDGVIFISIDDNEQHRLRMMMDEIFGEGNFYALINWTARNKPMNAGSARFKIQKSEELVCAYGKIPMSEHMPFFLEEKEKMEYPLTNSNGKKYREEEVQQRKNIGVKRSEKMVYSIFDVSPKDGYRWTIGQQNAEQLAKSKKIFVRNNRLVRKFFKGEELDERYHPLWANFSESCGTSEFGKADLDTIIHDHRFETVKPVSLIRKIVFHFTSKNALILDSFAGSGTTAHATLALNKQDGGNRKFILVECEDYADTITAERIRRVIKGVPNAKDEHLKNGLGGSFTYTTLGTELRMDDLLTGKNLPAFENIGTLLFHTATNEVIAPAAIDPKSWYLGESRQYHVWLIYKPDIEFLKDDTSALTLSRAEAFVKARPRGKRHLVFAPTRFVSEKTLRTKNIPVDFQPLPWALYRVVSE